MTYLISLANKECSLCFSDEDDIKYEGNIKDVALMFARHIYNTYNGYDAYTINNTFKVKHISNNFTLIWIDGDQLGDYKIPPP